MARKKLTDEEINKIEYEISTESIPYNIRFQIDIWKRASRLLKLLAVGQIWII